MRINLQLRILEQGARLPMNYQYELSSWIYRVLHEGDQQFSQWLHEHGYRLNGKQFRLFSFSSLRLPRYRSEGDRFRLLGDYLGLDISFCLDPSAEHFIMGLFKEQQYLLGDRISQVPFQVERISVSKPPSFRSPMQLRAISPVCISSQPPGRPQPLYHHPGERGYDQRLLRNLLEKYRAYHAARQLEAEEVPDLNQMSFRLLGRPKSRLITLAAHTPRQTKVRGYLYDFEIAAPEALLRFLYHAGAGEKNSMGFGCVGIRG
ncbi:MAG: CRISPR-associated endoribonuclease Cas6 [Bacteroidetes bacterium]|nr:MAG: CRISPR-associated endoribonuclease Cas6 [Bacteroidota bacterium]